MTSPREVRLGEINAVSVAISIDPTPSITTIEARLPHNDPLICDREEEWSDNLDSLFVASLEVTPDLRHEGIGTRLAAGLVQAAVLHGFKTMQTQINSVYAVKILPKIFGENVDEAVDFYDIDPATAESHRLPITTAQAIEILERLPEDNDGLEIRVDLSGLSVDALRKLTNPNFYN